MPEISQGRSDKMSEALDIDKHKIRYLSEDSPRDRPWDIHRSDAMQVESIYGRSHEDRHHKLAGRVHDCSPLLAFGEEIHQETGEICHKLKEAWFCRVAGCPVCQWRRGLMWKARIFAAMPKIEELYPKHRWLLLTLTVPNCAVRDIKETLQTMNKSWAKMLKYKGWPSIGNIKSIEVTKSKDGTAHPHFHILLFVKPGYFGGTAYIKHEQYLTWWRKAMKNQSITQVDIRPVKEMKLDADSQISSGIAAAIAEVTKYTVKAGDIIDGDDAWFLELMDQLRNCRRIEIGGVLKALIKEDDPEELITEEGEGEEGAEEEMLFYGWHWDGRRYVRR